MQTATSANLPTSLPLARYSGPVIPLSGRSFKLATGARTVLSSQQTDAPGMPSEHLSIPLVNGHKGGWQLRQTFATTISGAIVAILAVFAVLVEYPPPSEVSDKHVETYYLYYFQVNAIVFVGIGLLLTFVRRYSYSALTLTLLGGTLAVLLGIIVMGFVQQYDQSGWTGKVKLDLPLFIDANFAACAAIISIGAFLGKATPTQLIWLCMLEVPAYALSHYLINNVSQGLDAGGSLSIHAFGAYYGLAASYFFSFSASGSSNPKNGASYTSDIFAMLASMMLINLWPGFGGSLANQIEIGPTTGTRFYGIANTILCLAGSSITAFAASSALGNKLNMVHIQNSTLAGGVAISSACEMNLGPAGALLIGVLSGVLSVVGYSIVSPAIEAKTGLQDTAGIHNLHGMPGVLGGIAAGVASLFITPNGLTAAYPHGRSQWAWQFVAIAGMLVVALATGLLAGFITKSLNPMGQSLEDHGFFEDALFWEEVEEEGEHDAAPAPESVALARG
ncbi:hypothetical protein WJX73_009324 [Symbiochloris irregularis]|uniref:Ammonium transporter AmtB-like domain-containing protein n=1 Tax=Symbiochloris irregularis TaxID=706552 RepID=A0AAW1PDS7_9CHLO